MKNVSATLILAAVAFASGWTLADRQHPQELNSKNDAAGAKMAAQLLPERDSPVMPRGHPPILPEGHPSIGGDFGKCPYSRPNRKGRSGDESHAVPQVPDLITT